MANNIRLESEKAAQFLPAGAVEALRPEVESAQKALEAGTCAGNDFLGWLHLPSSISAEHLADLKATAQTLRENCDTIVVAGIGGSYLGARAVIEALGNSFEWLTNNGSNPVILFAGNNIGEDYLSELCEYLKTRKFGVINISKSGTTTETALAFRLLKKQCEEQRGKEMARKVIVAITDAKKGAARLTANKEGYKSFIIPDNVGGRFSVLTPVGLLPHRLRWLRHRPAREGCCRHGKSHWHRCSLRGKHRRPICRRSQRHPPRWKENRNLGQLPAEAPFHERMVEAALR